MKIQQREDLVAIASVRVRVLVAALAMFVLLAACGGGGNASGGDGGDGGSAPTDVVPTDETGGGDPGGDTGGETTADKSKGVAKGEVTGDVSLTFDLGVAPPPLSAYDLDASHGAYLIFADSAGTEVLYLTISDGSGIVQYVKGEMGLIVGAGGCTFEIDELDGSHAKGSVTCPGMTVLEGESAARTADLTFTFEARK
jgi:hypothetical protein